MSIVIGGNAVVVPIFGGGNKFELFAQLADIGRIGTARRPTFQLILGDPFSGAQRVRRATVGMFVNGIESLGGSGDSWSVRGFLDYKDRDMVQWLTPSDLISPEGARMGLTLTVRSGVYNTDTRKGNLLIEAVHEWEN